MHARLTKSPRLVGVLALVTGVLAPATLAGASRPQFSGTITIQAGNNADAASIVTDNPPGTTFLLAPGTHSAFSVVPRAGDAFVGEPGAVLDGGGTAPYAFTADANYATENNVDISGDSAADPLVIQDYDQYDCTKCASPYTVGAVNAQCLCAASGETTGWTLEDVQISDNATLGLQAADAMTVDDSVVDGNGTAGIAGNDQGDPLGAGVLIENTDISGNGPPGGGACPQATACAGVHLPGRYVANFTLLDDTIDDNNGPGVWFDTVPGPDAVTGGTIDGDVGAAVRDEAGGPLEVTGVTMDGDAANGGATLVCVSCFDLTASDNTIADPASGKGIVINQDSREYEGDVVSNIDVAGNAISGGPGTDVTDGITRCEGANYEPTPNPKASPCDGTVFGQTSIVFSGNQYGCARFLYGSPFPLPVAPPPPDEPYPGGGTAETLTFAQWQAAGFDVSGTATVGC